MWSFYDATTGRFTGRRFSGPAVSLTDNTPAGAVAIEGEYDARSQRVDIETGEVVAYQRPAAEIEAEQRTALNRRARQRISMLELAQLRPLRELAIDPANAKAKRRLVEIETEIAGLRSS